MASRFVTISFHLVVLFLHAFTFYYEFAHLSWPGRTVLDRFLKLTTYNFVLSTIYWILRLSENFINVSKFIKTKHFLLSTVLPLSTMVFLMFWAIFLYDPGLLRSPELRKYIEQGLITVPQWILHAYHTAIILFPLIDLLLYPSTRSENPNSFTPKKSVLVFCGFSLLYFVWMMTVGVKYNKWPYPLLAKMTNIQRVSLGMIVVAIGSTFSFVFTKMNHSTKTHIM